MAVAAVGPAADRMQDHGAGQPDPAQDHPGLVCAGAQGPAEATATAFRRDRIDGGLGGPGGQGAAHGVGASAADVGRAAGGGGDDPPHADGTEQAAIGLQGNAARQGLGDPVGGVIGQITGLGRSRSGDGGDGKQGDQERTHEALILDR